MAAYATLKAAIQAVIKQNGNNEITGPILQQALLSMINSLGDGYQFKGVATPATNPGAPDQNVFYIASEVGAYSNFGLSVGENEVAIFLWNGSWSKQSTGAASAVAVSQLGQEIYGETDAITCPISAGGEYDNQTFRLSEGNDVGIKVNADAIAASGLVIRIYLYKSEGVYDTNYKHLTNNQEYASLREVFDGYSGNIYGFHFYLTGITGSGSIITTFRSSLGLLSDFNNLAAKVSDISNVLEKYNLINVPFVMNKNQRLYSDGTLATGMSDESYVSNFIAVTPGKKYYYFGSKTSNSYRTIAGYASNIQSSYVSTFADPLSPGVGDADKLTEIIIPDGVNYIRVAAVTLYGSLMGVYSVPSEEFKQTIIAQIGGYRIWVGTQTEYDNIQSPDSETLYFIEQ